MKYPALEKLSAHMNECETCRKAAKGRFCGSTSDEIDEKRCTIGNVLSKESRAEAEAIYGK